MCNMLYVTCRSMVCDYVHVVKIRMSKPYRIESDIFIMQVLYDESSSSSTGLCTCMTSMLHCTPYGLYVLSLAFL